MLDHYAKFYNRGGSTHTASLISNASSSLSFPFHLSLSLLHKCQLPVLKAFCTDLRGSFYHSHYKSLTPVTLHCWYSSTIFYFVCFVTEYFGLGPRKCTLGLSRGLTGMKCELSSTCFATCCRPLQTGACVPLFSLSELPDNSFTSH